jgi:hypothetical protein
MKLALVVLVLLLAGCTTAVPIKPKFPQAPQELLTSCEPLQALQGNPKLSEVAKTVVDNYALYHQCANKVEAWHDWYQLQKSTYEETK